MTHIEALKLARYALTGDGWKKTGDAIRAIDEALTEHPAPVPPPWWPAVENILNEYGLQAIDFVADFKEALAQPQQEPCGGCGGSGWVSRDPDIGTDQECFVCEGAGVIKPEQEPVAFEPNDADLLEAFTRSNNGPNPFYRCNICGDTEPGVREYLVAHWLKHNTSPPQRPWQGLSDEEALECWPGLAMYADCAKFWENIEAKLKAKNEH